MKNYIPRLGMWGGRYVSKSHWGGLLWKPLGLFSAYSPSFPCLECGGDDLSPAAILWLKDWIHTLKMVEEEARKSLRSHNCLLAAWLHLSILIPLSYYSQGFLTSSWQVIPNGLKDIYTIFNISENKTSLITYKPYFYFCLFYFHSHVQVCAWSWPNPNIFHFQSHFLSPNSTLALVLSSENTCQCGMVIKVCNQKNLCANSALKPAV